MTPTTQASPTITTAAQAAIFGLSISILLPIAIVLILLYLAKPQN